MDSIRNRELVSGSRKAKTAKYKQPRCQFARGLRLLRAAEVSGRFDPCALWTGVYERSRHRNRPSVCAHEASNSFRLLASVVSHDQVSALSIELSLDRGLQPLNTMLTLGVVPAFVRTVPQVALEYVASTLFYSGDRRATAQRKSAHNAFDAKCAPRSKESYSQDAGDCAEVRRRCWGEQTVPEGLAKSAPGPEAERKMSLLRLGGAALADAPDSEQQRAESSLYTSQSIEKKPFHDLLRRRVFRPYHNMNLRPKSSVARRTAESCGLYGSAPAIGTKNRNTQREARTRLARLLLLSPYCDWAC